MPVVHAYSEKGPPPPGAGPPLAQLVGKDFWEEIAGGPLQSAEEKFVRVYTPGGEVLSPQVIRCDEPFPPADPPTGGIATQPGVTVVKNGWPWH